MVFRDPNANENAGGGDSANVASSEGSQESVANDADTATGDAKVEGSEEGQAADADATAES